MDWKIKISDRPLTAWAGWLAVALFAVTVCRMVFFQSLETAVVFSAIDDGLYYPRIAQNIAERGLCTYDGVTVTNGFHPLWLLVLVPVYALIANPWAALWGVYCVIFGVQLLSLWLLWRLARFFNMTGSGWMAAVFLLLLNIRSFTVFFSFLESPLVLLMLLGYLAFCVRAGEARFVSARTAFLTGVLTGLCFLSRLDTFLLPASYALVWGADFMKNRARWRSFLFSACSAAAGCMLFAGVYLACNRVAFGHFKTVSAWQKSGEISLTASWNIISGWTRHQFIPRVQHILGLEAVPGGLLLAVMILAGAAALVYVMTGSRRRRLVSAASACPEFVLFVLLHAGFIVLAAPLEAAASAWYWVPELMLLSLAVGAALPDIRLFRLPAVHLAVLVLCAVQWAAFPLLAERKTMSRVKMEVARFLRENMPPETRGAMFDSGIVSYFSQRDFAGLNGLIGDFEHAEMMQQKQYAEAFERLDVDFLVLDSPPDLIQQFRDQVAYVSEKATKFENFSEPPKHFAVYKGSPEELERIWTVRYGGMR